jgi:hypothetical protein
MIAASAASWLHGRASELAQQGKPWLLAVNLVNPHVVMFYNTDWPGEQVQDKDHLAHITRDPAHALYAKQWAFDLPASFSQRLDAPGRPLVHIDLDKSNDAMVGRIAAESESFKPFKPEC